jgi:hypothetical protein
MGFLHAWWEHGVEGWALIAVLLLVWLGKFFLAQ